MADPEGRTVERALGALGFSGANNVHIGKMITFELEAADLETAEREVEKMCDDLLVNPVIETRVIEITPVWTR